VRDCSDDGAGTGGGAAAAGVQVGGVRRSLVGCWKLDNIILGSAADFFEDFVIMNPIEITRDTLNLVVRRLETVENVVLDPTASSSGTATIALINFSVYDRLNLTRSRGG